MDKKVFTDISYGMYIVSCKDEKNCGCVINTLIQLTNENPIISICLNKKNYTSSIIKKTKKFAVSILSENIDPNIISKFGFQSSNDIDKFEDIFYEEKEGVPILKDSICGYLICEVINIIDVESHDLFIARVIDTEKTNDLKPMTYNYYHEVLKGKAPKKAPTYIEEKSEEDSWVCDICGYVHKGNLPDDFKCPICGADLSHFKKK